MAINFISRVWLCGMTFLFNVNALAANTVQSWSLTVGEVRVQSVPNIARVAVGDGHVLSAITTEEKEVIVFARNEGTTTVQLWHEDGYREAYHVKVEAAQQATHRSELKALLDTITEVEYHEVGDKLVIYAEHLSDRTRSQLQVLSTRYPQLLDLSDEQGWDAMVLLDVQVVEVPRSVLRQAGVKWGEQPAGGVNAGLAWERAGKALLERPGEVVMPVDRFATNPVGYFGINALLSARVQALSEVGAATVLAQPQLLARSGATAEFLAGGELPYSNTDKQGNSSTQFKPYGVSLKITPFVQKSGTVRSLIDVEVSAIDASLSVPSGPSLKTRRAATEFNVKAGQTLILAGFISREMSRNVSQVPGMAELPILGGLFRSERFQRQETELAIFVTPYIVNADDAPLQQRAQRAQAIISNQFPDANVVNTPLSDMALENGQRPSWALPVLGVEQLLQMQFGDALRPASPPPESVGERVRRVSVTGVNDEG